ncbi:Double-transmembrane region-like protein [Anopheles sinensis]|uniref:Double-transmembrane region-like protein n=1 Tax=Anopheles sinensis TaxID=74873 RepID=A0A084VK66_ANOSI|nr:Double-transmembrane region-like protein [Anopheles sinensis]
MVVVVARGRRRICDPRDWGKLDDRSPGYSKDPRSVSDTHSTHTISRKKSKKEELPTHSSRRLLLLLAPCSENAAHTQPNHDHKIAQFGRIASRQRCSEEGKGSGRRQPTGSGGGRNASNKSRME